MSSIIEVQDLKTLSYEELSGSLQAHEVHLNLFTYSAEEKALHTCSELVGRGDNWRQGGRGRGKRLFRGRGRGGSQEGQSLNDGIVNTSQGNQTYNVIIIINTSMSRPTTGIKKNQ